MLIQFIEAIQLKIREVKNAIKIIKDFKDRFLTINAGKQNPRKFIELIQITIDDNNYRGNKTELCELRDNAKTALKQYEDN